MADQEATFIEHITGEQCLKILHQACREKVPTEMSVPGFETIQARLAKFENGNLIVDDADPRDALGQWSAGQNIELRFAVFGQCWYLVQSRIKEISSDQAFLFIREPAEVMFLQQRKDIRIVPERSLPAVCLMVGAKNAEKFIVVEDISLGGACLSIAKSGVLRVGSTVRRITLRLADKEVVVDAEVRHQYTNKQGRFCVGLEWIDLNEDNEKMLRKYVMECQRFLIRHEAK